MLTLWLGICWPPGGLNQSRASFTESARTCPDRNDNDRGQSPPLCHAATEMCLFWNAHGDVRGEALHFDGWELKVRLKGESWNSTFGLHRILTYGKPVNIDNVYVYLFIFNIKLGLTDLFFICFTHREWAHDSWPFGFCRMDFLKWVGIKQQHLWNCMEFIQIHFFPKLNHRKSGLLF